MKELSIVIPTVKYNDYLDLAIESCFCITSIPIRIFVNINSRSTDFENSRYYSDSRINWRYTENIHKYIQGSVNDAIIHSSGDWIFLLSDDDIILPGFLKNVDFNIFTENSIFASRINIISETNEILRINNPYDKLIYNSDETFDLFYNNRFQHHLSSFIFSRRMYEACGPFVSGGYPNGYYVDTIFHGKLMSACDKLVTSNDVGFSRRESSFQESAKFYTGFEVNDYFDVIVKELWSYEPFKRKVKIRIKNRDKLKKKLLMERFYTECYKLSKISYNNKNRNKIAILYNFITYWDVGTVNKIKGFFKAILYFLYFSITRVR